MLLPGQFVRARIQAGVRPGTVMIPQRAVQVTPQGGMVMIVGAHDVVAARQVKLGELQQASWMVLEGLEAGDRVIVDGVQKVQPGQPVRIAGAGGKSAIEQSATKTDRSATSPQR
jgi:membrane fusion protein (multidrug efflux system)